LGKSATHLNPPAVLLDPCGLVCGSLVGLSAIFPGLFEVLLNPPGIRATHSGPSAISLDCAQVFGSRLGFECDPFGPSCDPRSFVGLSAVSLDPSGVRVRSFGFVCHSLLGPSVVLLDAPEIRMRPFWTHLPPVWVCSRSSSWTCLGFACDPVGTVCEHFASWLRPRRYRTRMGFLCDPS
jgi:hypothetical protein